MALVVANLQNDIYNILMKMNTIKSNGEQFMAKECAKAISNYISKGQINSVDTGGGSAGGIYKGKGTGTMSVDSDELENLFIKSFSSKANDSLLANMIASDMDIACSKNNICSTVSVGSTSLPPSEYPDGGVGMGTFSGQKGIIFSKLSLCFATMGVMAEGGNFYMATQFATAVDEYLKSGQINITLLPPLSGSGIGTIS